MILTREKGKGAGVADQVLFHKINRDQGKKRARSCALVPATLPTTRGKKGKRKERSEIMLLMR